MLVKSRKLQWTGFVARMGETIQMHIVFLMDISAWKCPLTMPGRTYEDNIKTDLRKICLRTGGGINSVERFGSATTVFLMFLIFRILYEKNNVVSH
jgi:hypothetical protein